MTHYNDKNLTSVIKIVIIYCSIMFVTISYDNIEIVIRIKRHNLINKIIVTVLHDNAHMSQAYGVFLHYK